MTLRSTSCRKCLRYPGDDQDKAGLGEEVGHCCAIERTRLDEDGRQTDQGDETEKVGARHRPDTPREDDGQFRVEALDRLHLGTKTSKADDSSEVVASLDWTARHGVGHE